MLYIAHTSEETTVILPKNTANSAETYDFIIKSQGTGQEYAFTGLTDLSGFTDYLVFSIDSTGIKDGEYEYSCGIEKGVLRVGDIPHNATAFTDDRTYIEYQD